MCIAFRSVPSTRQERAPFCTLHSQYVGSIRSDKTDKSTIIIYTSNNHGSRVVHHGNDGSLTPRREAIIAPNHDGTSQTSHPLHTFSSASTVASHHCHPFSTHHHHHHTPFPRRLCFQTSRRSSCFSSLAHFHALSSFSRRLGASFQTRWLR